MAMVRKTLLIVCMVLSAMSGFAQDEKKQEQAYDLVTEGVNLYDEGKYAESLKKYNEALKLDNTYASTYYEKALALLALEKTKDAKKTLQESFKKVTWGNLSMNYKLLADIVDDEGKSRESLEYYQKASELADQMSEEEQQSLLYNIGVTYMNLMKQEPDSCVAHQIRAQNLFTGSLVMKPTHAGSYYGMYKMMTNGDPAEWGYSYALGFLGWYGFFGARHNNIGQLAEMPDKWGAIELKPEELDSLGPKTRMSYELVHEAAKKEPSEYGKVFDVFMYAVPKVAESYTDEPVPLNLMQEDIHNEFLWPLYAKMVREGVFEAFCHVIAMRVDADYIANTNWVTKNEKAVKKLTDLLDNNRYFDSSLREEMNYGKVPSVAQVTDADDAHARNEEAKLACRYYLSHYLGTEEMQLTTQFLMSWMEASPDVMVPIGEGETVFLKEGMTPYLVAYMASCSLIQLDKGEKELTEDEYVDAVIDALNYYNNNKDKTGTDAEIDRLFDLGINDVDALRTELKARFPKAQ